MKVVVATDSYKGCLTSREAGEAMRVGILSAAPSADVVVLPVSDGGEGLADLLTAALGGQMITTDVHGPLGQAVKARYGLVPAEGLAVIEVAQACGLTLVPRAERNPELTTTWGVGELMADAHGRGCRRLLLGLGGTATCDGGLGMLQALGARIEGPANAMQPLGALPGRVPAARMGELTAIDASTLPAWLAGCRIEMACDVESPLCGPTGAARVYAPQKGADPAMTERLDGGLAHLLALTGATGRAGDGAAGGLAFALRHFLHAGPRRGIDLVLDLVGWEAAIDDADWVITGEGQSDAQTLTGKAPMGIMQRARLAVSHRGRPVRVALLSGGLRDIEALRASGFDEVRSVNEGDDRPLSLLMQPAIARANIARAARRMMSPAG